MIEQWQVFEQDMSYSVSDQGNVRNDITGNILSPSRNAQGIRYINIKGCGRQRIYTVAIMVASTYLPAPPLPFNTIIHLNGDRDDCAADNLAWRPRRFAIEYQQQFRSSNPRGWNEQPFQELLMGRDDIFTNVMLAGITFGVLNRLVVANLIVNRLNESKGITLRSAPPTGHVFKWL